MTRMIFEQKQPQVVVCKSGRAMIALNEQVVKSVKQVPVGMTEEGEMRYEEQESIEYSYDTCWLDGVKSEDDVLEAAKKAVLNAIGDYDTSPAVNSFYINGIRTWAEKEERMGFQQNIADKVALGFKEITWWFDGVPMKLPCDKAEQMRLQLENYAFDCFNATARHRAAVLKMESVEEVLGYDYTAGYPEVLTMNV